MLKNGERRNVEGAPFIDLIMSHLSPRQLRSNRFRDSTGPIMLLLTTVEKGFFFPFSPSNS